MVYRVWKRDSRQNELEQAKVDQVVEMLRKIQHVEDYIWPLNDADWLENTGLSIDETEIYEQLVTFRQLIRRWQQAVLLPIDQVVLTVAQDLLTEPSELAIAHKLAVLLARAQDDHPDWRFINYVSW
jgi:DNA helicase-2/ATP-dependent DNA helicase PcrA